MWHWLQRRWSDGGRFERSFALERDTEAGGERSQGVDFEYRGSLLVVSTVGEESGARNRWYLE